MPATKTTVSAPVATAGHLRLTPPANATVALPFLQGVELLNDLGTPIARCVWFTTGTDGVMQLLHVEVDPAERRKGVGSKAFKLTMKEADLFFRSRGGRLRRVFCNVEQKSHIVFRAWLTKNGFHPTNTMTNVLKKQDLMVYLLGCD